MTLALLSPATPYLWCSTPFNRSAERALLGAELKNEIVHDRSEVTFNDLPPGQVKITIAARNSKSGESASSEPVRRWRNGRAAR